MHRNSKKKAFNERLNLFWLKCSEEKGFNLGNISHWQVGSPLRLPGFCHTFIVMTTFFNSAEKNEAILGVGAGFVENTVSRIGA